MDSKRVKRTLDRLAYASLILDVCIAVITTLSLIGASESRSYLWLVNYLLTAVVALSITLFIVLLLLRAKERQAQAAPSPSS